MKVAYVSTTITTITVLLPLMAALRDRGVDVWSLCDTSEAGARAISSAGVPLMNVPIPRATRVLSPAAVVGAGAIRSVRQALVRADFDVVVTASAFPALITRLALRDARLPVIHSVYGWPFHPSQSLFRRDAYIALERVAGRWTSAYQFESADDFAVGRHDGIVQPAHWTAIVGGGVDVEGIRRLSAQIDQHSARDWAGVPHGVPVVGVIARFDPVKNHAQVIDALALLHEQGRKYHLLLVGYGGGLPSIRSRIAARGIGHSVTVIENTPGPARGGQLEEFVRWTKATDVAVLCSLREGLARMPMVAMAAGVPLVLSDIAGTRQIASAGSSALLVPLGDARALAMSIATLIEDEGRAQELAGRALTSVRRDFDERDVFARVEEFLRATVNRHPLAGSE